MGIIQPDLCVSGGFSEFVKIHALASTFECRPFPTFGVSGIAVAAALQAIATVPALPHAHVPVPLQNEPIIELDRKHNPLRDDLLHEPFVLNNGLLSVPQGPGLGVTVNEGVLKKYQANR